MKEIIKKDIEINQLMMPFQVGSLPIEKFEFLLRGYEEHYHLEKISASTLFENPYLQNIQIDSWHQGNLQIDTSFRLQKRHIFVSDEVTRNPKNFMYFYRFGVVPKDIYLPTLYESGTNNSWMSIEPSEINSFKPFIEEAYGNIVVIGCGLGYLAYMLSLKQNVKKITIVEKNMDVIKLFQTHILPQFKNYQKIEIILADAFEYLETADLSSYNYCSVDIWHNIIDMVPSYLECLRLEKKHPTTKFHYWLEKELLAYFDYVFMEAFAYDGDTKQPDSQDYFLQMCQEILQSQPIYHVEEANYFLTKNKKKEIQKWVIEHPEAIDYYQNILEKVKAQTPKYTRKKDC